MTLSKGGRFMQMVAVPAVVLGPAPSGPPRNLDWEYYSGTKILYTWTNVGPYNTQISLDGGTTVKRTEAVGETMYASGTTTFNPNLNIRHANNGMFSVWVPIFEF